MVTTSEKESAPRVAPLVLGSVQWGMPYGIANKYGRPSVSEIASMLDLSAAHGVRTIDTARAYGESEAVIGELVGSDGTWAIVTKVAPDVYVEGATAVETRERALASLAASRTALRRERLDVVLLHRGAHRRAAGGAAWEVLLAQRQAAGIGAIGISAVDPDEAREAVEDPAVEAIQVAASLLDQRLERTGFFGRARALGKRIFVRSVFLQGVAHLKRPLPTFLSPLEAVLHRLERWAREHGLGLTEAFLLYARDRFGTPLVVGCESALQLATNLHTLARGRLGAADLKALEALVPDLAPELIEPAHWPRGSA